MQKLVLTAMIAATFSLAQPGLVAGEDKGELVRHTVVKGDTLWDLGGGYLNDHFSWPKIWELNPEIADPHWIYPGQVFTIPKYMITYPSDKPAAEEPVLDDDLDALAALARQRSLSNQPLALRVGDDLLDRMSDLEQDADAQLLARQYDQGIGMVTRDLPDAGRVLSTQLGWGHAAGGEAVLIETPDACPGQKFGVYRNLGAVPPLTYRGESPGYLLADIAIIEVVGDHENGRLAVVRRAFAELKAGDLLGPAQEKPVIVPGATQERLSFNATVVALQFQQQLAGPGTVVYLNAGRNQGLKPGLRLAVREPQESQATGEVMVLQATADRAAALVTEKTRRAVKAGDQVGPAER
ncbi:MAG TPA: LysM peptidoglycan-binding domain-containing protein [Desulfurivibrio alkaliphilus]|uniref:LysM peptidoglycan-binding domain-containing protein n=1 Tax=Desulfurivibrio alkaliphilus TaxID=427923 RepID=A0A7C2TI11_9BACT|nr:LysM peptidoglycan-binding domain-containing protein [Desulfurivibrio alkaliphilus]